MFDFNNQGQQRDFEIYQAPTPENNQDPVEKFLVRLGEFDLKPGVIVPDGELHRFGKNKVCWYVFHSGDICGAAFGDWKTGLNEKWCSKDVSKLTYEQRQKYNTDMETAAKVRKAQEKTNHAQAKKLANELWDTAEPVTPGGHAYLVKKGLTLAHNLRVGKDDYGRERLIVPTLDENGKIWSLQFIDKDGKKRFQPMGKRKGLFFEIPGKPGNNEIYITEGPATGASINEITGAMVICAFSANQMPAVAKKIKELYPGRNITIAADNDRFNTGANPGIDYGIEAAREIDAPMTYPKFTDDQIKEWREKTGNHKKGPTDFNDLAAFDAAAVVVRLKDASKKDMLPPLTADNTSLLNWLPCRPIEREVVLTLFGKPLMTRDLVGVLSATGGTGKTFWLMGLAHALATGGSFGPIKAVRKFKVLVICAEDDQNEIGRRLWDICGGVIPKNLHAASIYGEVGPLMRVENGTPKRADGFHWLEDTLKNHAGFDFLIMDPKSRLYGLDENSNDHATEWIRTLEYLCKRYIRNLLFATHTSQDGGDRVTQKMNRGASAIVDGCRWQGGLAPMDKDTADKYKITNPRDYIVFDVPKSNYSARQQSPIYYKRTNTGALEYVKLERPDQEDMTHAFLTYLKNDSDKYSINDLKKEPAGRKIYEDMKQLFPDFNRKEDFEYLFDLCLKSGEIKEVKTGTGTSKKTVIEVVKK